MNVSQITLLSEYLERAAARYPTQTALVCQQRRLSWRDVDVLTDQLATMLKRHGVRRADRVVVYLDNAVEACLSIFAIAKADAVFCLVNHQTKADKLSYLLDDSRATVLISDRYLERVLRAVLPHARHLAHAFLVLGDDIEPQQARIGHVALHGFERTLAQTATEKHVPANIPLDLAALIYTSGTTGKAKGVMLTHYNMVSAVESITTYLGNGADDVVMNVLPLSFDYGLYQWLMACAFGGRLVLERSFNYPSQVLEAIEKERCTGFPVVPTIVSILQGYAQKGLRLPNVRYVTNTGAALAPKHIETLRTVFENADIYSMYGLTECKRVSYLPPDQLDQRPDSVGKPMPNMEVFIVDPDGRRLPPNRVGELVVRGPTVMRGYWEAPQLSAARLEPGDIPGEHYLRTGDLFRMDDEGFLYFVGRDDDIIKSRGEKVAPREVENVLYAIPGVKEAAVVGIPDELLGSAIKAYLVLDDSADGLSPPVIVRHCASKLEPFMVPRSVTFLSSLPKTDSGKISKKQLAEWAEATYVGGDPV